MCCIPLQCKAAVGRCCDVLRLAAMHCCTGLRRAAAMLDL